MSNTEPTESQPQLQRTEPRQPISLDVLEEVVRKWLLIADPGLIKVVVGTVIANRMKGDPVWLFIVAAPGGTKTEIIRGLNAIDGVYQLSDLTPQTFLSGERGSKNASLLHRIPKEKAIFTYKDFTTVLGMHQDKSQAILSQLREIYDGYASKDFGTGERKEWKGKVGFIAGVTTVIDRYQAVFQVLGERFIQYRPEQPNAVNVARRAMANSGDEEAMRDEINNAFQDCIESITIPETVPELDETLKDKIAHLAALCVQARSGVIREGYSSREIELIPAVELPTRLSKQLTTLMTAFRLVGYGSAEADYALIYKIGMDSIPHKRRAVLEFLMGEEDAVDVASVASVIGYPSNSTRRVLEDLAGLGLVKCQQYGPGNADDWQLGELGRELLMKAQPIPETIRRIFFDEGSVPEKSDASDQISLLKGGARYGER